MDAQLAQIQAQFCRAMGNPVRVQLMYSMRDGERCVSELIAELGLSQPVVSQHLAVLRNIDMVATRRQGQNVFYRLTDPEITDACDLIRTILTRRTRLRSDLLSGS